MLFKIFKRKKRVFLGQLMVVPRESWKVDFDSWGLFKSYNLEEALSEKLKKFINLPPAGGVKNHDKNDLALDLAVVDYQGGEFGSVLVVEYPVAIFWRPKICIKGRLYNISSGKTLCTASKTVRCSWSLYITRVLSLNGLFRYKPLFNKEDMEALLCKAAYEVLTKLNRKV